MIVNVEHTTHYTYSEAVKQSTQFLRLMPKDSASQKIISWEIDLPVQATQTTDAYGNILHVLTLDHPHQFIAITVRGKVEVHEDRLNNEIDNLSPLVYLRSTDLTEADEAIIAFAEPYLAGEKLTENLEKFSLAILERMPYTTGATRVFDSASVSFASGKGVCQDHSHVFVSACRHFGIPARYVSGYIATNDDEHVASHAWAEAWIDGQWHGLDITNQLTKQIQHVRLAVGLDYLDACPIRGVRFGGGTEVMTAIAMVGKDGRSEQSFVAQSQTQYQSGQDMQNLLYAVGGQQ